MNRSKFEHIRHYCAAKMKFRYSSYDIFGTRFFYCDLLSADNHVKPSPTLTSLVSQYPDFLEIVYMSISVATPRKWSPEAKIKNRRRLLRNRLDKRFPLFSDLFFNEETKRAYYNDANAR